MRYYKYLDLARSLAAEGRVRLCVVGQDPYNPPKACGIAFCTNTFEQLLDGYTCGEKVLRSLGINDFNKLKEIYSTPVGFFNDLASKAGIVFINLSRQAGKLKWGPEHYDNNCSIIEENLRDTRIIIDKATNVVLLGKSFYKEFTDTTNKNDIECILHPSGRASQNSNYDQYWGDGNYLKNKYLSQQLE